MKPLWLLISFLVCAGVAPAELPGVKLRQPAQNKQVLPPPAPNFGGSDVCSAPDVLSGPSPYAFDNTFASTGAEGQGEAICNQFANTAIIFDVWFTWTAPSSGIATLTTVGLTTVDTKVAAYSSPAPGGGCPTSAALACNDDDGLSGTFQSTIAFPVSGGFEYMIQLGCYPGAGPPATPGTGQFSINISAALPNDDCSMPTTITGFGPGSPFNFDTTTATTGAQGQGNAVCNIFGVTGIDSDVWYEWTSPVSGWIRLTGCAGMAHDAKVAIYTGSGCPVAEPVACDDDACATIGAASEARWLASAGQLYTIQLGSYPGSSGGPGFFTIENFTPAVGDQCSAPILIAGPGPHNFDDYEATTGTEGQTNPSCTTVTDTNPRIAFDVWYKWTAPSTGTVTWSLCAGASMDSKIAVYQDSGCPTGLALTCNDDFCLAGGPSEVTFAATAGQSYMLQLGVWPGSIQGTGSFTLAWTTTPTGTPYCYGDGTGTNCPCSTAIGGTVPAGLPTNGCPNSLYAGGAHLWGQGSAQFTLGSDSFQLRGTGMANSSCLYFQGSTQVTSGGMSGSVFGDGLRCATTAVKRLGTKTNVDGSSAYPVGADQPISIRAGIVASGTFHYQAWYRNAALFCITNATFNLTNGLSVSWSP